MPVLVRDLALLLVGLNEHACVANEVRVALGQDELHRLRVHEGDEPEHAFLLVGDAHVVDRTVDAAPHWQEAQGSARSRSIEERSSLGARLQHHISMCACIPEVV
jgi:hypothetical protein